MNFTSLIPCAALIAAVGLGFITFDNIPNLIRIRQTFRPHPANRKIYDELFDVFVKIYKQNRKIFKRLNC